MAECVVSMCFHVAFEEVHFKDWCWEICKTPLSLPRITGLSGFHFPKKTSGNSNAQGRVEHCST